MKQQNIQKELQESSTKYIYELFQKEILWVDQIKDDILFLYMNRYEKYTQKIIKNVAKHILKKYKKLKAVYIGCYFFQRNSSKIKWVGL